MVAESAQKEVEKFAKYRDDPAGFAREVLKFEFTPLQIAMAEGLIKAPFRVLAPSANEQGKTAGAAAVVLWWFCTRSPAIIITTAPKFDQVKKLLWKEIRRLARRAGLDLPFQPKACEIQRSSEDFAIGTTARDATSFHGHHGPNMLFVIDEGTGVDPEFFTAIESMFSPPGHAWLVIFNPTTTASQVFIEYSAASSRKDGVPPWKIVAMSALDHPNIDAELRGQKPPVPHAMRVDKFGRLLAQWSTLTGADPNLPYGAEGGPETGDVVWPPVWATKLEGSPFYGQEARVYRPGPEAESRLLARFPSQGTNAVWGDGDWQAACRELPGMKPLEWEYRTAPPIPEIGCDVARFGDDMTETHARSGSISLSHESVGKRPIDQTAGRLKELAKELAAWWNDCIKDMPDATRPACITEFDIPIKVDDTGVGGGVTDILVGDNYNAVPINSQNNANDSERYPNIRSELWFVTAERARRGELDLSGLPADVRDELRRQAVTAKWKLDSDARRVVDPKDKQKEQLKRSCDSIDAMNLAYYGTSVSQGGATPTTQRKGPFGGRWAG